MEHAPLPTHLLTCPLCRQPLHQSDRQLLCSNRHSFDLARQGYVNLLPVQQKKSLQPGDSVAMVEARHRFLEQGCYAPISDWVNRTLLASNTSGSPFTVLDAGCGEGYYLRRLSEDLKQTEIATQLLGLDISKPAIQMAAKLERNITWLVASGKTPPLAEKCFDAVLCLFGFCFYEEFARLLTPGGRLLRIDAGPNHLLQLRQRIYPELKPARPFDYAAATQASFELSREETLSYTLHALNEQSLQDLLAMTPHLYRADKSRLASLRADALPEIQVEVVLREFSLAPKAG